MTSDGPGAHDELLKRVGIQLGSMSTAIDHLLLTRWRVLGLCQFLVGGGRGEAVELSVSALDLFIREEPSRRTDAAFRQAGNAIARAGAALTGSVLPKITPEKQKEVRARLEAYEAQGASTVAQAIAALPSLRDRLQRSPMSALLAGIRHRLELVASLVTDGSRSLDERQRAAAAILYLDEFNDAIPDTLVYIGLLDDDFAFRLVLSESDRYTEDERLHWAERITALWDDLPFLQGVNLGHQKGPSATTWLDRINSYVSYSHALDGTEKLLILVQPSVACSPLHSIVSPDRIARARGPNLLSRSAGLTVARSRLRDRWAVLCHVRGDRLRAACSGLASAEVSGWHRLSSSDHGPIEWWQSESNLCHPARLSGARRFSITLSPFRSSSPGMTQSVQHL